MSSFVTPMPAAAMTAKHKRGGLAPSAAANLTLPQPEPEPDEILGLIGSSVCSHNIVLSSSVLWAGLSVQRSHTCLWSDEGLCVEHLAQNRCSYTLHTCPQRGVQTVFRHSVHTVKPFETNRRGGDWTGGGAGRRCRCAKQPTILGVCTTH